MTQFTVPDLVNLTAIIGSVGTVLAALCVIVWRMSANVARLDKLEKDTAELRPPGGTETGDGSG